jgi:hypothetical protein
MDPGDPYRKIAAQMRAKAVKERSPKLAAEWSNLARCYVRLAEQADSNSFADIWFEIGPKTRLEGEGA